MRFRGRWFLVLALCLALITSACSKSDEPGKAEPSTSGGEAGALTSEQLVALLAGAGIGTYVDASAREPVRATETAGRSRLLQWQVDTMTRQLNAKRGYRGTDLDALTGTTQVPISVVLAAYVKAGRTPGAEASRTLMGDQDFDHHAREIVYPDAVLAFFVNDLAAGPAAAASPAAFVPAADGICSQLQEFLSGTLDSIVEALKIDASTGVGGVLATIWNTVIEIAASAAKLAVQALTAPVLGIVKKAAALLAVLSSASSLLDPWTVTTTGEPDPVHASIGGNGNDVTVTTAVKSAIDFTWPADVKDCAGAAGVDLPDPGSPQGSPVTWTVTADPSVATVGSKDTQVGADGTATLHLTTGTETQADHDKGDLIATPVAISTKLERTQVKNLLDLVHGVLIDGLPGPVQNIVSSLLGPLKSSTQAKLADLLSVQGPVSWVTVNHHGPAPEETPSPSATPTDCGSTPGEIPDGAWQGPITMDVDGKGGNAAFTSSKGTGTMKVVVENGSVKSGTWSLAWHSTGHAETAQASATVNLNAKIAGKVTGPAAKPVVSGSWNLHGKATVTKPRVLTVPIDESGQDAETMTVESTSCDQVTGTFLPSFNSKDAAATFTGTARWVGARME